MECVNDLLDIPTRERAPFMDDLPQAGETKTDSYLTAWISSGNGDVFGAISDPNNNTAIGKPEYNLKKKQCVF